MREITFNSYGAPNMTDEEKEKLHEFLTCVPCKACGAESSKDCEKVKGNAVHMGRLPSFFDSYTWLVWYLSEKKDQLVFDSGIINDDTPVHIYEWKDEKPVFVGTKIPQIMREQRKVG